MAKNDNFIAIVVSIFIPPLGVLIHKGMGKDALINLILTLFFYLPGLIHAIWVITKK